MFTWAPDSEIRNLSVSGWNTFVVPHTDGQDDIPGLMGAIGSYSTNSTILFQKGVNYNAFTPIKFPILNNVEIRIEGNLSYPTDIPTIQAIVGSSSFPGSWFTFSGGNNVTLRGSTDPNWGWIDGHGQAWWDTQNQVDRPHGIAFSKINNGIIRNMKLWKPIAWNFATSGSTNLHAFNNKIVAVSSNPNVSAFPFNTNSYCEGGHGLSIGSLGKGGSVADVQDVLIENVVMNKTLYGARFKSWTGGNGLARKYFVEGATGREVVIFDLHSNTATNIVAKDIFATTESGDPVAVMCDPTTVTNDVGFKCQDGVFIPTKAGLWGVDV
ncbi:hypothetical protein C0989_007991 [Termitomyces sp. Mn162]|nr:hypothetical protein C0989_007991 [Termitomyces sp. Mn162]